MPAREKEDEKTKTGHEKETKMTTGATHTYGPDGALVIALLLERGAGAIEAGEDDVVELLGVVLVPAGMWVILRELGLVLCDDVGY